MLLGNKHLMKNALPGDPDGKYRSQITLGEELKLSNDFGVTWRTIPVESGTAKCCTISGSGQYQVIAIEQAGKFAWKTSNDYGQTFSAQVNTATYYEEESGDCSENGQYFYFYGKKGLHRSTNYGVTFTLMAKNLVYPNTTQCDATGQYIYVGSTHSSTYGGVYISTNYGASFTQIASTIIYRQSIGATGAAATGNLSIGTITASTSFVINSVSQN